MLFLAWIPGSKYLTEIYITAVNTKEDCASDSIVEFQRKHMSQLAASIIANDDNFGFPKRVSGPFVAMNTTKDDIGRVLSCIMMPSASHEPLRVPLKLFSQRKAFSDLILVRRLFLRDYTYVML